MKRLITEERRERRERQTKVLEMHHQGWTYPEIAAEIGVSVSRASQICRAAQRHAIRKARWCDGLPVEIASFLVTRGYRSKRQVARDVEEGNLDPKKTPRYGPTKHRKVRIWLGLIGSSEKPNEHLARGYIAYLEKFGYRVIAPEQ